ncbi:hypothetical protein ACROYT_G041245 [Oculina patagonica]
MKKRRGKHKRGERGSTEDESNSAKKLNMDVTECASDKDGGEGDEDPEFYETVPEQEPSLRDIKDMLSSVQTTLKDIQTENRKLASEVADLKSSFGFQEKQINSLKVSLSKAMKANDALKLEVQALRKKVNDQKSEIDELYESHDDLEQYTRKNSVEIHGVPENFYTSTEDVVIKLGEVLNVPIQSEDIDISHKLYSGKNNPKNIIVKFISHKKKTALYKKRTELKNVKITQLFPHSTTAAALASHRLYINENLTSFRKDLMKEANQMRKDGLLVSVWSMDGKIFVKASPDGAPKRIHSQEDLDNETFSEQKDEPIWKSEWGGAIFFSHGSTHSKGVSILINPSSKLNVQVTGKDLDGRIVSINLIYNSAKISICNIYAPNDSQQQQKFLLTLNRYLMSHTEISNLIVGGDWNVTLQACDKKGGIPWRPTLYRDKLIAIMDDIGLIDVFRKLYPNERSFTYESKSLKVKSRIDFFLVSKSVENWVVKTNTKVSNAPDHKAVVLELKILSEKRGPGLWKFNNSLVEDNEYVELIEENYAAIREKYSDLKDDRLKWELIRMEIRRLTISYSKHKVKQRRIRETELQKRLEALEIKINNCNTDEQSSAEIEQYDKLKTELQRIYEAKGKGAIFRSKVRWIEQAKKSISCEKPTKYFFNLEKRNFNRKVITEIKREDGKILVEEDEIMKEIESFYENLYASHDEDNNECFNDFVHDLQTVKLTDEEREALEGYITIEECSKVLKTFPAVHLEKKERQD